MGLNLYSKQKVAAMLVAFLCSSISLPVSAESASTEKRATSEIYFTLGDDNNAPLAEAKDDFDCTDQIFTVVNLTHFPVGKHKLSIRWKDPNGDVRENTRYPFRIINSKNTRLWAWLSLSRAKGAGILSWLNPAAGLEEFIGEWKVEVRVNNKLLNKGRFLVTC